MLSGFVYGLLAISWGVAGLQISEPVDVHQGPGSSGFSYYGTSPESPDGRRLTYVVYPPETIRLPGKVTTETDAPQVILLVSK